MSNDANNTIYYETGGIYIIFLMVIYPAVCTFLFKTDILF